VGAGNGVDLGEAFGGDNVTLDFAELPIGYPPAVTVQNTAPEPSAAAILCSALFGMALLRRRRHRAGVRAS
jgi:hypothetical protein